LEASKDREAIMDSVLFTDHGVLVFVIIGTAIALVLSVLGLATTQQTHSDIKRELAAVRSLAAHNERNLLKDQFHALVREGSDSIEDIFDAQFRRRFIELIDRSARTDLTLTR
jgi:hypothetical protein